MDPEVPQLLSLLAHELRSPVGVIRGYLRMLEQLPPGLSDQQKSAVSAALRATDRAAELLTQTSMLAQLQLGEMTFDFRPVELPSIVAAVVDGVQVSEPLIDIAVGEIPAVSVDADEALLRRTLTTLIGVVSRADVETATLRITPHRESHDGVAGVALEITAANQNEMFSARAIDISRGGIGLELPIAENVILAHRGRLRELRQGDGYAGMVVWLPVVT